MSSRCTLFGTSDLLISPGLCRSPFLSLGADQQPAKGESHVPHGWHDCSGCRVAWFQNYAYNLTAPSRDSLLKMEITGQPVTFKSCEKPSALKTPSLRAKMHRCSCCTEKTSSNNKHLAAHAWKQRYVSKRRTGVHKRNVYQQNNLPGQLRHSDI